MGFGFSGATSVFVMDPDLADALNEISKVNVLLVVCDLDGTIAPLCEDPSAIVLDGNSIRSLESIGMLGSTHVAILSGRTRSGLVAVLGDDCPFLLIGEHGAEIDSGQPVLTDDQKFVLDRTCVILEEAVEMHKGAWLERKKFGAAIHFRLCADGSGAQLSKLASAVVPLRWDFEVIEGKSIVEVRVGGANKGAALEGLRHELNADAVLFVGDDQTDEDAFETMGRGDLAIKVGNGATLAWTRVPDETAVGVVLEELARLRAIGA